MKSKLKFITLILSLFLIQNSYAQSEDLFMQIWHLKDELKLSEGATQKFECFKEDKTRILTQIKELEAEYFSKLEAGEKSALLKTKILALYEKKHDIISAIKKEAIEKKDEALFLEIMEHIRPKDLKAFLSTAGISESHEIVLRTWLGSIQYTEVGTQLKDFSLLDQNGNRVTTQSLKGKVFWIDSWASKCAPCIKKLKQMKSIYPKYHSKGFEILALSWDYTKRGYMKNLDAAKADWIKIMNKFGFHWLNVFDEGDHVMGGQFGSVGKNLLIDENGIILGFDLHPLEIEKILQEKY